MPAPYLSIVIPAYNEEAALPACLQSLYSQITDIPYEVIVVDNNSSDGTAAIVRRSGARLVSETMPGVCAARNAGLQAAHGEVIISTDADCIYPAGWLDQIGQTFRRQPDLSLLSGNYTFLEGPRWANPALRSYEWLSLQLNYAFGWHAYVSAANLAFRKKDFPAYDTRLTQGGDELYVLGKLKPQGRILYHFTNPVSTSSRRLHQGFTKTFFGDFFAAYLINYLHSRLTGKNRWGTYKPHRQSSGKTGSELHIGAYVTFLLTLLIAIGGIYLVGNIILEKFPGTGVRIGGLVALTAGLLSYAGFNPHSQLGGPQPFRARTSRQVVALTFDDGPNDPYSTQIADVLESYDGRATFFQVGQNVTRDPQVTRILHERGHLIGNHSLNHSFIDFFRPGWSRHTKETSDRIRLATGSDPQYVRLPWLFRAPWLIRPLYAQGLQPVAGTFVSIPEFSQPDGVTMARRFAKKVKAGDILIMHDGFNASGGDRSETVRAVRELCSLLQARGFSFVRVDELL